ncbi:hypothetical protein LCGC14_0852000 [marine sediment metagenome]|uniref:histidine kinase n=1 Tax=marine sediment metagenome TaxID=412755 RepID=A0A0F9P9X0_9ZZZZ
MGFNLSLEKRLNVEKLISAISSRFVGKIDPNKAINSSLKDLGNLSGADRVSVFLFDEEKKILSNTHEWCNDGIKSQLRNLQNIDRNTINWWISRVEKLNFVNIPEVSTLPNNAKFTKDFMESQNIKSFLGFPIYHKTTITGFACFSKVSEKIQWKGKDFSILRIFSQILENTFDRLNAENALRANQELLSAIFEAVAEGIIAINSEGRITQINARFIYMWRVPDEIVEKSDFEILMEEVADQLKDSKIFIDKAQSLRKTSKTDFNMIICKDGRIFDQYSRPITLEGKIIGRLWSFRDVTEHQNAEQELRKSEKLYRDAYERANFYKDIFTHDMNNIFHNIQFSAELISMLKDNVNKIGTPEDLFTTIIHQIDRGSKLIENVRKLSKLEESKVSLQNLEIYEFLENAILFAKKSVRDKKIEIKIKRTKENVFVEANEFLLDVFENILHNATKYNKNPIISVQIIISKEDKYGIKFIKMEFLDNGIGIDDKSKKLIFLKGYKKDKNIRGMGIGLSLVKKIIESFNGKIWVENRIQDDYTLGSNFVVEIPELN